MVTAKNLIKNSKADLGWDARDADYTSWRNAGKDYCAQHEIKSWSGASDAQKQALVEAAWGFTGFRPAIRARLASGSEFHKKALESLWQDCMKNRSESAKYLAVKRALKRTRAIADDSYEEDGEPDVGDPNTAMVFWIMDPDDLGHKDNNGWMWDVRERRKLGIIAQKTLDGIWEMVKTYIPERRKVREIWGALADPDHANPTFPASAISLAADGEVLAFLRLTTGKPIRILIMLHEAGHENIAPNHFSLARFDPPVRYADHEEDSDAVVHIAAGVRQRPLPNADHTFEQRIHELRYWEKRQHDTKQYIKQQHEEKYPNAIHSNDENFVYIACLRDPDVNSGQRMLLARQVVPCARRTWDLHRSFGVGKIQSLARSLSAAQNQWEDLQPGAAGHPGPAPKQPPIGPQVVQPVVPPVAPQAAPQVAPRAKRGKGARTRGSGVANP